MKKILFIGMTPNKGGLETFMLNVFNRLQGKGYLFYFVNVYNKNIAYSKYICDKGGKIYNVTFPTGLKKYMMRYLLAKKFFKTHHDFDIIHINALSVNEVFWAKAAKRYGINNIILHSHNSGIVHKTRIISLFSHIMAFYNKIYLRFSSKILKLAASYSCGEWMFGCSPFQVINNGINTKYFYPSEFYRKEYRDKLGINLKYKILITTARLDPQKNYTKIIRVFYQVHKKNKYTYLVIIGSGNELSHIKGMVHRFSLDNFVLFLGMKTKSDVSKLLNIGDVMIMPSHFEAVPFSLTEAQSVGVPAVVSKEGIPWDANVTHNVKYVSLNKSDSYWALIILKLLQHKYNYKHRLLMNNLVNNSPYNIVNTINNIRNIYSHL